MSGDPRHILANSPMNALQITAVAICIILNALDGFDVLAISFASPGIVEEWNINRAQLGIVLSMELFGMAGGSILLGGIADKVGRRPTIIACLLVMSLGMYLASVVTSLTTLSVVRLFTGVGIGGMLAAINAMAAEYSNARFRNLAVILMATGYPLGAVVGGSVASLLLISFDWRAVFLFGAIVTGSFLLLVWFLLPESIEYLAEKRPAGALERINATLKRMGHQTVEALPSVVVSVRHKGIGKLFSPALLSITVLLTLAYFAHIMTFYYIIKWIPKIVVDMGYAASSAGGVLVWANVGGATGCVILSLLTRYFDLRRLIIVILLLATVMVIVFGLGQSELSQLATVAAVAGFFTNSAVVGLYALFAQCFPTEVRASGTGFAIGVGRGGAALGPIVAGFLFAGGHGLITVSIFMSLGSLIAAFCLMKLRYGQSV
ncbi:MAG: MFS transporter [Exilibacterium sp.]